MQTAQTPRQRPYDFHYTFIMNTRTRVRTLAPHWNEFGHVNCTFVFIRKRDIDGGRAFKVYATYGSGEDIQPGDVVYPTQDTGMGHRAMPTHQVDAVIRRDEGDMRGDVSGWPVKIPFWVTK